MNKLRVWWIPQVPAPPMFHVEVETPEEAVKIMDVLANYDLFQYENKIKPDYSNVGGLEQLEDGEWTEWYNDLDEDIVEYAKSLKE